MGVLQDYEQYDSLGLAELVRRRQVTALELCEASIERINRYNPLLNAVIRPMFAEGRKAASQPQPDAPFAGVPFLLKDLGYDYAGVASTNGCRALTAYVPEKDSEMVARFKKAGLVILGKTNTPEFGLLAVTEPELFGPCRNPWNTDHTPGGSSGGSASAIAAGMTPAASGNDGGGSIRIPAACCGLFGLKPTRGRNPGGPDSATDWRGAVQNHVITRSVRDSAALLDATQGEDSGAPFRIPPPQRPYLEEIGRPPGRLKIAFSTSSPIHTPVHPECVRAVEKAARLLEDLGHHVEEMQPDIDGHALATSYLAMCFGEVTANIDELASVLGRKAKPADMEAVTWTLGLLGRSFSSAHLASALRVWDRSARKMGRFFDDYHIYMTPTTAFPPAKVGELNPKPAEIMLIELVNTLRAGWLLRASGIVNKMAERSLTRTPFTQLANLCGLPAMSVPLHWTPDGLPCGNHFTAPFGEEAILFKLAAQLEEACPWFDRRPRITRKTCT
jgi:amidase